MGILTNEDIEKLKEILATKKDFARLVTLEEFDQFKFEIKQDFEALRESIQALTISVDKLAKAVEDMHQEYLALTLKVDRHEKWIQQIAGKLGVKLEY
ncbi:MAG: hypothetical protein V1705_00855 [bacterium]